jgi:hypothetical protein
MSKTPTQLRDETRSNDVLDRFARVRIGTLVRRSKHWYREHPGYAKGQLGIVTGHHTFQEDGRLITYPIIHWQTEVSPSTTHPANAEVAPSAFKRTP